MTLVPDDTWTLGQAKQWLREHLEDGQACPCCTQFAKVYRRKLTSHTAVVLIRMFNKAGRDWVYLPDLRLGHADEAKARYWTLIEPKPDEVREDGSSRTGWWRLTPLGDAFVHNRTLVAKYARVYDGRLLKLDDAEQISIVDALGTKFDYRELMMGL